jgi:hypothetical protein
VEVASCHCSHHRIKISDKKATIKKTYQTPWVTRRGQCEMLVVKVPRCCRIRRGIKISNKKEKTTIKKT